MSGGQLWDGKNTLTKNSWASVPLILHTVWRKLAISSSTFDEGDQNLGLHKIT